MSALADGVRAGDRRMVARALTVVERRDARARDLHAELWPHTGRAFRVGVTGAPGVGKSTLVDAVAAALASHGARIGVIAVDPTSPYSGGALLGDRLRMQGLALRDDVFVRSMASRGRLGGLAPAASEAADVLDAAGFPIVVVETVGAGQGELDVAFETDYTIVVLAPGAGDGVQAAKAGTMEIADLFVVNKSDLPGAEGVRSDVEGTLELASDERRARTPIVMAHAGAQGGAAAIAAHVESAAENAHGKSDRAARRRSAIEHRLLSIACERAYNEAVRRVASAAALVAEVEARRCDLYEGARRLEIPTA
jgi:LAO/AO transport system kinase